MYTVIHDVLLVYDTYTISISLRIEGLSWLSRGLVVNILTRNGFYGSRIKTLYFGGGVVRKIKEAGMRILIWMCGHTRRHKIKNKFIQDNVVLTFVVDKIMEATLRLSGYMT
ncbi:hypothetical protein H5410_019632 [Solanum commersonii]|uniref:Uncharacterized protein n=1 Tax=Solanum commersonii TaxID=4109 RepID=A0A9J5Z8W6_SOLCO|nr:hypothetical protein H5410_019632 [Solanum commersonii]